MTAEQRKTSEFMTAKCCQMPSKSPEGEDELRKNDHDENYPKQEKNKKIFKKNTRKTLG